MKKTFRKLRALFFKRLYGNPSSGMRVIGVTGTDGKTTTCEMLYNICLASGYKTGVISTVGAKISGEETFDTGLHTSTPSSQAIYKMLKAMKQKGVTHCILELTSHGLDQDRPYGIVLDGAVYTNITSEHLDYHKTVENYRAAKAKLIDMVHKKGFVVINKDDANYTYLATYATNTHNDLQVQYYQLMYDAAKVPRSQDTYVAYDIKEEASGYRANIQLANASFAMYIPLGGKYNIANALAALSAAVKMDMKVSGIITGIGNMRPVEGRMDIMQENPFLAIVDFAHTANAQKQILSYIKEHYPGRRIVVMFGCAGLRDAQKRPEMGNVASSYADVLILTAEDPRSEKFSEIIDQIKSGIVSSFPQNELYVIESREEAIKFAIQTVARPNDIVLFLGKGHEKSMCIGDTEYPWDEQAMVKKYLS